MGQPAARVDIIMVTFESAGLVAEGARRLLASEGVEVRLLVHDNGSRDRTVEILQAVPGVDLTAGRHNLGFAAAMNQLLARTDAEWVLLCNPDAWPLEDVSLAGLVAAARAHPDAAVVAPQLRAPDGTVQHSTFPFPGPSVAARCLVGYQRWGRAGAARRRLVGACDHDSPAEVEWAIGAVWLIRRAALADIGPFDERFFLYGEDIDWCWRARDRGWKIRFEPASRFVHVGGASAAATYGEAVTPAHLANTHRLLRRRRGRAVEVTYRTLNLAATARLWWQARRAGDHASMHRWRAEARAALATVPAVDAPPEGARR